jgi:hypothetical protein
MEAARGCGLNWGLTSDSHWPIAGPSPLGLRMGPLDLLRRASSIGLLRDLYARHKVVPMQLTRYAPRNGCPQ